jgi:glycogen debranching enzyme
VTGETVQIFDGNTFVVSAGNGDIEATMTDPYGLFANDTRFLSRWVLSIDGERLNPLAVDDHQYFECRFFLVPGVPMQYVDATLSVVRQRSVSQLLTERLIVLNHEQKPVEMIVRLDISCDFADVCEVKNAVTKRGVYESSFADGRLRVGYRRERFHRETVISTSAPAQFDGRGFSWTIRLDPQQDWYTDLCVEPIVFEASGRRLATRRAPGEGSRSGADVKRELDEWMQRAPSLDSDWGTLVTTYRRSLVDLAALRFVPLSSPTGRLPAGGLPWFMSVFGRDGLLTSLQVLPFFPELAATTLGVLGLAQGGRLDDFREEEPGKIPREIRYGESAAFQEQPHTPYFGSADSTPLYVVLLDEYERWTGDADLVRRLEPQARAALGWIDEYGDLMGNGYVSYLRRNAQTGLENQGWKESPEAISYRDGRVPSLLRATCELQGYAYDARVRGARLARQFWGDPGYADRLERQARDLKDRFDRDFWVEDGEYYALALDAEGGQVDALASNMGHLLWSGIVQPHRAQRVVAHLMGPRMFSGWGVRTLATGEGRYNPVGYHIGTVWPFDNSFIAWGLRSYGFKDEAARIAQGILEAAEYFQGRLPEAFAGYDRELTRYPVQYPTACSPQAWSTGTPLLLLRTMLGLEPRGRHLTADPALPGNVGWIGLLNVPGRWGRTDAFGRGRRVESNPGSVGPG